MWKSKISGRGRRREAFKFLSPAVAQWAQFRGDSRLQDPPRRYQKRPCALWDPASARSYRVETRPVAPQPPPAPAQVCCRRENLGPSITGPRCSASKSKPFTTSSKLRPPATPSIKTASQHLVRDRALSPACLSPLQLSQSPSDPTAPSAAETDSRLSRQTTAVTVFGSPAQLLPACPVVVSAGRLGRLDTRQVARTQEPPCTIPSTPISSTRALAAWLHALVQGAAPFHHQNGVRSGQHGQGRRHRRPPRLHRQRKAGEPTPNSPPLVRRVGTTTPLS